MLFRSWKYKKTSRNLLLQCIPQQYLISTLQEVIFYQPEDLLSLSTMSCRNNTSRIVYLGSKGYIYSVTIPTILTSLPSEPRRLSSVRSYKNPCSVSFSKGGKVFLSWNSSSLSILSRRCNEQYRTNTPLLLASLDCRNCS